MSSICFVGYCWKMTGMARIQMPVVYM